MLLGWQNGNRRRDTARLLAPELAAFVAEKQARSLRINWDPVWVYRSAKREVEVHFADIANERRLARVSRVCERQYLAQIEAARQAHLEKRAAAGVGAVEALRGFERALCRKDLYYLTKYVLGYDKLKFHVHRGFARSMENLPAGYRGLREAPRDSYKTTVKVIGFMVQQVLINSEVRILLKSNADGNAAKKLMEAKEHFFPSGPGMPPGKAKKLPILFPEHCPRRESDKGSGDFWRSPASRAVQQDGTFVAAGVGSTKVGQHFDIIIGDDFWDEKSVTSLEVSTKTEKELDSLEYMLISPAEGKIILVGTRFAHDDPTTKLMRDPSVHCVIVSGMLPNGRSLFPEALPLEMYQRQARRNLYVFSCQVMLNPQSEDAQLKVEWLQELAWETLQAERAAGKIAIRLVMLTDAAADGKKTSDNVALMILAIDSRKRKTIVAAKREKMEPSRWLAQVEAWWDEWKPELVVKQKTTLETTIASFARELNEKRDERGDDRIVFYDYSLHKREKKGRITASLQPRMQGGEMYADPGLPCLTAIKKEMQDHPNSREDDFLDAWSEVDDPVVGRVPVCKEKAEPAPETYVPADGDWRKEALRREEAWRQEQARAVFAQGRGEREQGSKRPRVGAVVR